MTDPDGTVHLSRRGFVRAAAAGVTVGLLSPLMPPLFATAAPTLEAETGSDDITALGERVTAALTELNVAGAAVGLIHKGQEYTAGFGLADRDRNQPAEPDTGFAIASITKSFTGLATLRLVEQRRLDLDTPVQRYLPGLQFSDAAEGAKITLRHLLTHTAGLDRDAPLYWPKFGEGDYARARMIERFGDVPQRAAVGSRVAYSNLGIDLAGRIIEVAAGVPLERYVHTTVLEPLQMRRTSFFADDAANWPLATGYGGAQGQRPWPAFQVARAASGDSGLVSSVSDLLRYARFWLDNGPAFSDVLKPESRGAMLTPQFATETGWIGLIWFIDDFNGTRVYSHSGLVDGFASRFTFVPDQEFALVVLTNGETGELHRDVTSWALERFLSPSS